MKTHTHSSCCDHTHDDSKSVGLLWRWLASFIFICFVFFAARPLIAEQLLSRGSTYLTYELYDDAIRTFKKAVWLDKNNSRAWEVLGYSYQSKGDPETALRVYRDAIKINPENINALFGLGAILTSKKRFEEAVTYLERARAVGPAASKINKNAAFCYKSSLRLLLTCYEALKEHGKEKGLREDIAKI